MSYLLLGTCCLITSGVFIQWFSTFPGRAAAFPFLITVFCFLIPGIAALVKGVRGGELAKCSLASTGSLFSKGAKYMTSKRFLAIFSLFVLTLLYIVATDFIGFYPSTVLYFLAVLLGIYRMPLKGTLLYMICNVVFLYVFFTVIFKVRV